MKVLLTRILIGLGAAGFVLAALTVLLFNRTEFGWQALSVPTGSMRPTMSPGALVITHRVPISSLKVGDVITHINPLTMRSTLTHRIVKVYKIDGTIPAFVTKGDANPSPDPPVVAGLVQGKMIAHVPYVGELLMWAKTWVGIAVLVYLPALIIMIQETRRMAGYLRQMKPYHLVATADDYIEPTGLLLWRKPAIVAGSLVAILTAVLLIGWTKSWAIGDMTSNHVVLVLEPNNLQSNIAPKPPATCQNDSNANVSDGC